MCRKTGTVSPSSMVIALSYERHLGFLTLHHAVNEKVARNADQEAEPKWGFEGFPFYIPMRRPNDIQVAIRFLKPMEWYGKEALSDGYDRPFLQANCHVMDRKGAFIQLDWKRTIEPKTIVITTDTDSDHAMETVQYGHPESIMPFCLRNVTLTDDQDAIISQVRDNHQTRIVIALANVHTTSLRLDFTHQDNPDQICVYGVQVYE